MLQEIKINEVDKCVYMKNINKVYVIVYLYINDMLILGNNDYMIKSTKKMLPNKFDMKNLSIVDVILRIKISKRSDEIALSQFYYVEKILDKFSKSDNNIVKH
jgi:hypothetical protein